jgi:hypothetical protein
MWGQPPSAVHWAQPRAIRKPARSPASGSVLISRDTAILSAAAFPAERRACPERSRRDLRLNRPNVYAKLHTIELG